MPKVGFSVQRGHVVRLTHDAERLASAHGIWLAVRASCLHSELANCVGGDDGAQK